MLSVKERILAIRLIQKMEKLPNFGDDAGIKIVEKKKQDKPSFTKHNEWIKRENL